MQGSILLSAALQNWERYSAHALAAREVAAALAKGGGRLLQVLSVYSYPELSTTQVAALSFDMETRQRDEMMRQTDVEMERRLDDYIEPLKQSGLQVEGFLRIGNPRQVIVETALRTLADRLVIGSHSKRGFLDVVLGGTARQISEAAPCPVILVSPNS